MQKRGEVTGAGISFFFFFCGSGDGAWGPLCIRQLLFRSYVLSPGVWGSRSPALLRCLENLLGACTLHRILSNMFKTATQLLVNTHLTWERPIPSAHAMGASENEASLSTTRSSGLSLKQNLSCIKKNTAVRVRKNWA